jgi:glucose-6-phosphate isomerase
MTAHAHAVSRPESKRSAWQALENHYRKIRGLSLQNLFGRDVTRGERFTAEGAGIYLDYSKNHITDQTLKLLFQLAEASGLHSRIDAMFRGEKINITEQRPALHVALRAPRGASIFVDGDNIVPSVYRVLDKMTQFCNSVRSGERKGSTGNRIRNVVNIGGGGSYLGPMMAYHALKPYSDRSLTFRFVCNTDDADLNEAVRDLDPSETLFIVCSKTFASPEVLAIACSAREWLLTKTGLNSQAVASHFVAVSTNYEEAARFGIDAANTFEVWDWIGDRFSIDSAVGLSTMLAIGPANFTAMLKGLHEMDMHFLATPFERSLPVLLGLLVVWYVNLFRVQAMAVKPYGHYLNRFPAYLQHLSMGSNGKHVTLIGTEVTQPTGPLYVGNTDGNSQHSFNQWILQGTRLVPCDFIVLGKPLDHVSNHHEMLVASAFAQAKALALGKQPEEVKAEGTPDWLVPHRVVQGNRPSNTILLRELTPDSLGRLIALYEHSVFTQGVVWNINPFDQWGSEAGEAMAREILPELESSQDPHLEHDSSTNTLIRQYRKLNLCT